MNRAPHPPHGELVIPGRDEHYRLSRMAKTGAAMRLAPGIYAVGATLPPEHVARQHVFAIISAVWPDSVVCGKSALAGGKPVDGEIHIAHPEPPRKSPLELPGVVIHPFLGPPAQVNDARFISGLYVSGEARKLVENVATRGRQPRFRAGTEAVDDRIDELARSGGPGRIQQTLTDLETIAGAFDPVAVKIVRDRLIAVLGTFDVDGPPLSGRLSARLAGSPYDAHRIALLEGLIATLQDRAPAPRPALGDPARWEWLPFFEAYFSNFIEGTEFGVDEARLIAVEGVVSMSRPEDAHDVAATYRLAADPENRVVAPRSGDELIGILKDRHRILLAARPDKHPGDFKAVSNYAGGYEFVAPELVAGTLRRGFDLLDQLTSPFARAVAMMALVTECHPFDDGNGRIARLAANSELSVAGEVRIVIPTVYRTSYLAGLTGFSNQAGQGEQLIAVMDYAQRWAAAIDWSSYQQTHSTLEACNAYLDAAVAEATGRHLLMPRHRADD